MYGNKIDNLIILKEKGMNVPDFWIVGKDKISDLSEGFYAVRSSSNVEDGVEKSFAGQFQTYLNVSKSDLFEKIELCQQSLNSENVKKYIKENKLGIDKLEMNVLVQKMVNSEVSGVLFSCNPLGILNEFVFSVAKGLGENVVQDKVNSINYYFNITDNNYYYEGTEDLLGKEKVIQLVEVVKRIQKILDLEYVDIEFAIENNTIYILQARRITTMTGCHPLVLDNSNIVESYPGISLPLTISFVNRVYSSLFRNVSFRLLRNEKLLEEYSDIFNNMVGSVNGRIYYKISNWYALIKFLPMSSKIIPIWQEMLGVKNKDYIGENQVISVSTKIKTDLNFICELIKVSKNMQYLADKFEEVEQYFRNNLTENVTNSEIIELYSKIEKDILEYWDITLINDMYSFIFTGLIKKLMWRKRSNLDINEYIAGISNIESLKPLRSLVDLAVNKNNFSTDRYIELKQDFINLYGDRSVEELKLETKTFRTNSELLDNKIEEYLKDKNKLLELKTNLNGQKNLDLSDLGFFEKRVLKHCTQGIKNRELSRLNRTRIYGMVRSMMLKIGENLYKSEKLDEVRDIFYLEIDEIFDSIKVQDKDLKDIVRQRKEKYKGFEKLPPYSRLIFENSEFDKRISSISFENIVEKKDIYQGVPCSSGEVVGEVVIVDDLNDVEKYRDKILVTKMTDPGWVYLLSISKGIISEKGSLLSHTAIVSRELKIPFVTGVSNAVNIFKNGDIVFLNGSTGDVAIKERDSDGDFEGKGR